MELDDKHIKILSAIDEFNRFNHMLACKKDIERKTKFAYNTITLRLKDLETGGFVTVKNARRITEIKLTEKGNDIISNSQKSIDEYAEN